MSIGEDTKKLNKTELVEIMKKQFKNFRLPEKIDVRMENNVCSIILDSESIVNENMQVDKNAFEGWVFAIYCGLQKEYENKEIRIELAVNNVSRFKEFTSLGNNYGHYGRFLYRALLFREQYGQRNDNQKPWFRLSDELKKYVDKFGEELSDKNNIFVNNVPDCEASENGKLENTVEKWLSEDGGSKLASILNGVNKELNIEGNEVFRQFPVGLFKLDSERDKPRKDNKVFTGGKSAIDLWTWNESDKAFHVVELKARNEMVGIITEIFFYSNYMKDLLLEGGRFRIYESKKKHRGYSNIKKETYNKINGIMLADCYHPIVCDAVLKLMNSNGNCNIKYFTAEYEFAPSIRKKQN